MSGVAVANQTPTAGIATMPAIEVEWAPTSLPSEAPSWVPISGRVRALSTDRGRPDELGRFSPGSLSLTLNNRDGALDPSYSGPWSGGVLPNRRVRVLASWSGTKYVAFDGFVDGIPQFYNNDQDAWVSLTATGASKTLGRANIGASLFEVVALSDPPVAWWPLDDTNTSAAQEIVGGTASPGVYYGTVTVGEDAITAYDGGRKCVLLDGTSGRVFIGDRLTVGTFIVFFQLPTVSGTDRTLWYSIGSGPPTTDYTHAYVDGTTGKLVTQGFTGGLAGSTLTSADRVDDSACHSFAVVNATAYGSASVYVDGVLVSPSPNAFLGGGPQSRFGAFVDGIDVSKVWNGWLSNIMLFAGALTADRILALHQAAVTGLPEGTGTRAGRILDYVHFPQADRDIDTGSSTLGAHEVPTGSALTYLEKIADTEQGQFYCGQDGPLSTKHTFDVVWRQRSAVLSSTRSLTSQATFGDGAGELPYTDIVIEYDETLIRNDVAVTPITGLPRHVTDATSIQRFNRQSFSMDSYASGTEARDNAFYILARYKDPAARVVALTIRPQRSPSTLWPKALGLEIGDRVTVKRRAMGATLGTFSQESIIEGISHSGTPGSWETTFKLAPADAGPFWILDDATYSVLDTTTRLAF